MILLMKLVRVILVFFFSSRRRHTRLQGDWSSDVCSSDLRTATSIAAADAFGSDVRQGREQEIAVLFADLRGFTRVAEHKLPYDVVFILNRYFEAVGGAIQRAGGIPNQFTGDGVMAVLGIQTGAEHGCRQAVAAAREIVQGLAALNHELGEELQVPLKIGIGIHAGPAIVGQMGYGEGVYLTAVGDTVPAAHPPP